MSKNVIGSVIVVGGGITGMQSAIDLADSGYYVHLVEKSPSIGAQSLDWIRHSPPMAAQCELSLPNWSRSANII